MSEQRPGTKDFDAARIFNALRDTHHRHVQGFMSRATWKAHSEHLWRQAEDFGVLPQVLARATSEGSRELLLRHGAEAATGAEKEDDQDAAGLLLAASDLVSRAIAKLDSRTEACRHCAHEHALNKNEWTVFTRLAELPAKLDTLAARLRN